MSAVNEEVQLSSDALPFRRGARDAAAIRAECPQFRILIIGKANAGKTTILRKVCNAKPDAKPIIYDAEGKEVQQVQQVQQVPTKVCLENFAILAQLKTKKLAHRDSSHGSRCLKFFDG